MSIIHGRNVILSIGGVPFASAKSCELNIQADTIETSSPSTGAWSTYIPGRKSWTMTLSHLVLALGTNKNMVGTTVSVTMSVRGGSDTLTGSAVVKQWRVTGTVGNLAQGSFSFQGNGALT